MAADLNRRKHLQFINRYDDDDDDDIKKGNSPATMAHFGRNTSPQSSHIYIYRVFHDFRA